MSEAPKSDFTFKVSSFELSLIYAALMMLKQSSLRALQKEVDPGIRAARENRAKVVTELEVKLANGVK